jgi:2-keto-4-pentenoate hydratase/2-oxohepta-3-ene-1,7-dioic acid hydratase in catechol pathway
MKIICIGRNYAEHVKELNNDIPKEPVFFMKPDSSLLIKNRPFFLPDFSQEIHFEVELVLKINRIGKNIGEKFAHRYYSEIGLGIDFTARDIQRRCKEKGLPWEIAKSFDASAVLGKFLSKDSFSEIDNIEFSLKKNGEEVQKGNSGNMIFSFDETIAYISRFCTLKMGDLIYTGTPAGVGQVKIDDRLEGYLGEQKMFDFMIK